VRLSVSDFLEKTLTLLLSVSIDRIRVNQT
jgi:hypothetical protein